MIILDTHIWIWHVQGDKRLSPDRRDLIRKHESGQIGVCAISLWEVAKAVELNRLVLPVEVDDWFTIALGHPGIVLLPLTPEIAVESTRLPEAFNKERSFRSTDRRYSSNFRRAACHPRLRHFGLQTR